MSSTQNSNSNKIYFPPFFICFFKYIYNFFYLIRIKHSNMNRINKGHPRMSWSKIRRRRSNMLLSFLFSFCFLLNHIHTNSGRACHVSIPRKKGWVRFSDALVRLDTLSKGERYSTIRLSLHS